ncbi:MAG: hypothetical protein JW825_06315 [Candidatus Methanofastidiosa archaeon]|nr:hypothetical protein [Candidatus Methanofastidiosa archaeon]
MPDDDFPKRIERTAKKIGKDIEEEFKDYDFEKKMDDFGKNVEKTWNEKVGILGPAIISMIGFAALSIFIYIFKDLEAVGRGLANDIASFFEEYLLIFLVLMLAFNYGNYFLDRMESTGKRLKPLLGAASFTISMWFLSKALYIVDDNYDLPFILKVADFLQEHYIIVFVLYVSVSYAYMLLSGTWDEIGKAEEE